MLLPHVAQSLRAYHERYQTKTQPRYGLVQPAKGFMTPAVPVTNKGS